MLTGQAKLILKYINDSENFLDKENLRTSRICIMPADCEVTGRGGASISLLVLAGRLVVRFTSSDLG
jgi:hypothetical protein